MPTYTFMNLESGIEYDEVMSMSEYDKYMEDNPNIERVFQPVALAGDHMMVLGLRMMLDLQRTCRGLQLHTLVQQWQIGMVVEKLMHRLKHRV